MRGAEHERNQEKEQHPGFSVSPRPAKSAQVPRDGVGQETVRDIRSKKGNAGAVQTEPPYTHQRQRKAYRGPGPLAPEKDLLLALSQNDEPHRPGNDLEGGSKTYPTENSYCGSEFRSVKERDDNGCKGESCYDARARQQQTYASLLIHQAVARGIVFGVSGQTRVEIRAHGLQNKTNVESPKNPGRLIEPGRFNANFSEQRDSDHVCHAHRHQPAGHEREPELQKP